MLQDTYTIVGKEAIENNCTVILYMSKEDSKQYPRESSQGRCHPTKAFGEICVPN